MINIRSKNEFLGRDCLSSTMELLMLFLIFDDCKILNKDLHQLILDYEKKWNYSISSSHWVVYAKGNYFIAALQTRQGSTQDNDAENSELL